MLYCGAVSTLAYEDHRKEPQRWADMLGISRAAIDLYLACEVIDLHVDTFIWNRIFGYDLTKRHGPGPLRAAFMGQCDLPRLREARVAGAIWSITTNPARSSASRARTFSRNLERLKAILESCPDEVAIVRNAREYRAARQAGRHAAFVGIQGGNALDGDGALDRIVDDLVVRITLVHLSNSTLGTSSAPGQSKGVGLTERGRRYVQELNARRIFVDLAHISPKGFWDAVEVHDRTQPLIVTHTGVAGVTPHWRNLDDDQLRAVARSGGTVGVMYQASFLGDPLFGGRAESIVRHLEHIIEVAGEDCCSLGSDWDGAIVTPRDMPTCLELPRLVQLMLDRGWSEARVQKALGQNFLRVLERLRP